jgi:hypothetical protein
MLLEAEPIWTWSHFFFGLTYAIVASLIFLFVLLFLFRPYLKIGDKIASHIDETGKACFRFKFYNRSFFSGHDAVIDLRMLEDMPANPTGKDVLVTKVELTTRNFPYIPRYIPGYFVKNYAYHCIQVKTYADVRNILSDRKNSLQLRIILKHGLTGLSKNYIRDFNTPKCIVNGEWVFGNSLEIN